MVGMLQSRKRRNHPSLELVFLGTSGAIQVPSFHCSCQVCEAARKHPKHRRTRASLAIIGKETVLIDASPDFEFQLERERIKRVDRIFVTHWHFDHVWGLGALGEPPSLAGWPPIEVYVPRQVIYHFDQELAYIKERINVHPIQPSEQFEFPDANWEVVKTTHTSHSVGFIVNASKKLAYLVDGVTPPTETMKRLKDLDILILEATVDKLLPRKGEKWMNFSLQQAVDFWRQTGVKKCILTHISCHTLKKGRLIAGLSHKERLEYETRNPGLKFAYDGMRVTI